MWNEKKAIRAFYFIFCAHFTIEIVNGISIGPINWVPNYNLGDPFATLILNKGKNLLFDFWKTENKKQNQ